MLYRVALVPRNLIARVPRRYAADFAWTLASQGAGMVLKMLVLILLARMLGPVELGLFIAIKATVGFVVPLSGWGYGEILIRNVSRDRSSAGMWWGNSIVAVLITGGLLGLAISLIGLLVVPSSRISALFVMAATQLILLPIHAMTVNVYRATMHMAHAAQVEVVPDVFFVAAAVLFAQFGSSATASEWVMWRFGSMMLALVMVLMITLRTFARPTVDVGNLLAYLPSSTHFAAAKATSGLNRNLDSVLIARFASLEALGIFSAAWVVAGAFQMPFNALGRMLLPRLFELSEVSARHAAGFARKTAVVGVAYGVVTGFALFMCAPLIPKLLGPSYIDAIEAIRWLAILPGLYALSSTGGMTLTSLDRPQDRTTTVLVVLVLHVALALWLLPRYSWMGAVTIVLATELMLALGFWAFIRRRSRQSDMSLEGATK